MPNFPDSSGSNSTRFRDVMTNAKGCYVEHTASEFDTAYSSVGDALDDDNELFK